MKDKKIKGFPLIIVAVFICAILFYHRGTDMYSVQYSSDDFREVYLEGYSGDNSAMLYYVPKGENTVKLYTKGPVSLVVNEDSTEYFVELQYAATDDSTVLKVFASDYISEDNSGGKVFINERLDPEKSALFSSFILDQPVDSLFVTLETKDDNFQIGRFNTRSAEYVFSDTYILIFMVFIATVILLYLFNCKRDFTQGFYLGEQYYPAKNTMLRFVFIGFVAVFISSLPILDGGIIIGHDTEFHMARIVGIARGLQSGQFPVRIHGGTLNDYGYPNSLFYPELLLYIPAILNICGVSVYMAFKIYIVMINALTLIISYIAFKKLTQSRYIGMTLAIVYLLAPYRILCAYWRHAIGEFTAMTFLPFVLYGLYAIVYGNKKDWFYLTIGATGVLQSHVLSTEMTALFAVLFILFGFKNLFTADRRMLPLIYAALSTVMLNLWFLGPMIIMMLQLNLIVFDRKPVTSSFASYDISHLFSINKVETYLIGIIFVFALGLYTLYRILNSNKQNHLTKSADNFAIQMIIFMWVATAWFPWALVEELPIIGSIISSIQFPTRVLTIIQLCGISLLGSIIVLRFDKKEYKILVCFIIVIVSVFLNLNYMETTIIANNDKINSKSEYENRLDIQSSIGQAEYLISGNDLNKMIAEPPVIESNNSTMQISEFEHWGTKMSFHYSMDLNQNNSNNIILPITYIPTYEILLNGESISSDRNDEAKIEFSVAHPEGDITVRYKEPMTFRVFELITLVSIVAIGFVYKKELFLY